VVEQIFRVALKFAFGMERETLTKAFGRALIQLAGFEIGPGRGAPRDLVGGELITPAQGVPKAGVVIASGDRAFEAREAFTILAASCDQCSAEMFERVGVVRIDLKRASRKCDACADVARLMSLARLFEERARFFR